MIKYYATFGFILAIFIVGSYFFGLEPTELELTHGKFINSEITELNQSGHTEPYATVTINGENIPVDKNGNFYKVIKLKDGQNIINVTAKAPFKSQTKTYAVATRITDENDVSGEWSWNGTVDV